MNTPQAISISVHLVLKEGRLEITNDDLDDNTKTFLMDKIPQKEIIRSQHYRKETIVYNGQSYKVSYTFFFFFFSEVKSIHCFVAPIHILTIDSHKFPIIFTFAILINLSTCPGRFGNLRIFFFI